MKIARLIIGVDAILISWILFLLSMSDDAEVKVSQNESFKRTTEATSSLYEPAKNRRKVPKYFRSGSKQEDRSSSATRTRVTEKRTPSRVHRQKKSAPEVVPKTVTAPAAVEEVQQQSAEVPVAEEAPATEDAEATEELPLQEETPAVVEDPVPDEAVPDEAQKVDDQEKEVSELEFWKDNVCGALEDSICHEVFVVADTKATFCSAAKVASTTTKTYFYKLSDDLVIPENALFGVHEANWIRFHMLDSEARKHVLTEEGWTHIFFWKHVLERFVSGYLDKVVHDCEANESIEPHLAIHHYLQYGFSCEEHKDLEAFVSFMENVPSFEGHFHAQAPLCSLGKFPFTDMISADETLSDSLKALSEKLGVEHPLEDKRSSNHSTKAKAKMVGMFKDRSHLIQRILDMFKVDCENIPGACDIDELMAAIVEENEKVG